MSFMEPFIVLCLCLLVLKQPQSRKRLQQCLVVKLQNCSRRGSIQKTVPLIVWDPASQPEVEKVNKVRLEGSEWLRLSAAAHHSHSSPCLARGLLAELVGCVSCASIVMMHSRENVCQLRSEYGFRGESSRECSGSRLGQKFPKLPFVYISQNCPNSAKIQPANF